TTVYSVAQADQASENVLSSTTPLALTVATSSSLSGSPTPTTAVTETPTPTTETSTVTPTSATNQPPLCTSLSVDSNTATAGGSINFTANGNSPAATVSKVTFNFGDGNTLDVTDGGGIGTNNVSLQQAHTYATDGAYTATAIMTDVNSLISNSTSCSQVITIGTGSALATNPTTAPATTLPSTGPGDTLVIIGIVGAVLSVIGGLLFFGL
ncbi:MAG TPA: PKD domain-containing protein, partial [Candidatus Saccharimonadales bacterium]|nr:PKD domain-containing protein [Candidatus Saccharimonadales bacterium]